jgi:holo-[acyl-carrier protein] synthase
VIVGIGVDVVDVARLGRALERTPALAGRVFLHGERAYAGDGEEGLRRLAARFAAKEAAAKALGAPVEATWQEAEVVVDASGRPSLHVHGRFAEIARERGVRAWHLSLSHDGSVAVAMVVAES